jgi:hypothetical protein
MSAELLTILVFLAVALLIMGGLGGAVAQNVERQEHETQAVRNERHEALERQHAANSRKLAAETQKRIANGEGTYQIPDIDHFGQPPATHPLTDAGHDAPRLTARVRRAGLLTGWDCVGTCSDAPKELPAPKEG